MRSSHLLALTVVTAVLALPVVVFGEFEPLPAEVVPSPPMVLADEYLLTADQQMNAVSKNALDNKEEDKLTKEAEALATSTTTTSTTTTTTLAPAPAASSGTQSAAAPPAKSSGSGSSGSGSGSSSPPATQAPAPTTTKPPPPPSGFYSSAMESDFYGRINSLRASNGLGGLSASGSLASYARSWAKWMGDHGKLAHSSIGSLAPPWSSVAENVGRGGSVGGVFSALAGSSGHLSNMLGNFTHVGVGVWVDSSGTLWTVHVFAR